MISVLFAYLSILIYIYFLQQQKRSPSPFFQSISFWECPSSPVNVVETVRKPAVTLCYDERRQMKGLTGVKYKRLPYNNTKRNEFNDVYVNMYNTERMTKEGEFVFMQDHVTKYYSGSSPDKEARTRNSTEDCYSYDITLTSQTS